MTVRAILSDPVYPELKNYALSHTGLAYYADKDEDFATRVARRIAITKAPDCAAYLAMLHRRSPEPGEIDALIGELTIGETYFFRQSEHFELLRSTIFPDLLRRNNDSHQLRIWSAGCATGAEPFSVAVLLHTEFAPQIRDWDISILGTDINPDFLAQARTGNFSEWTLREVPQEVKDCCFRQDGKRWILASEFRKAVTFHYHNLADDSNCALLDGRPFDLILCRNVMIYFSEERNRAVAAQFLRRLADGGWLLVGHAESNLDTFRQFEPVHTPGVTVYRKKPPEAEAPATNAESVWLPGLALDIGNAGHFLPQTSDVLIEPGEVISTLEEAPADRTEGLDDASVNADRGEWAKAEMICRRLLDRDPLNAPAHFLLGLILAHTQSLGAAIAELRRAIYVDHHFALAFYHLGTLLQRAGRFPDARKAFRNAQALLEQRSADETVEHGDGISAGELCELTRMHQEIIGE